MIRRFAGPGPVVSPPEPDTAARLTDSLDSMCAEAATLIHQADVLLLCTGAGFSADSGLAIYADVAKFEADKELLSLEYHDICQPHWLDSDPALFWGFWGQCYNDCRETAPHPGYEIIDRWAENRFRFSEIAKEIRENMELAALVNQAGRREGPGTEEPYVVQDYAGGFFVFTSNVDAHHFDWFRACEIRECHGNTEMYQCSSRECSSGLWRAPMDYGFQLSKESMLSPTGNAVSGAEETSPIAVADGVAVADGSAAPRIGRVFGEARTTTLRYMPGKPPDAGSPGFQTNHPTCPTCKSPARPAIPRFSDKAWKDLDSQKERFQSWRATVNALAGHRVSTGSRLRAIVMEIGAGNRVKTVRNQSESCLASFMEAGADVKLIRVNPDFPLADRTEFAPDGASASAVLSIMGHGLETLKKVDAALSAM